MEEDIIAKLCDALEFSVSSNNNTNKLLIVNPNFYFILVNSVCEKSQKYTLMNAWRWMDSVPECSISPQI